MFYFVGLIPNSARLDKNLRPKIGLITILQYFKKFKQHSCQTNLAEFPKRHLGMGPSYSTFISRAGEIGNYKLLPVCKVHERPPKTNGYA